MKKSNGKFTLFLRRNAVYLVLAFCILAVGISIIFMVTNNNPPLTGENDKPVIETPIDPGNSDPTIKPGDNEQPSDPTIKPDEPDVDPVAKPITFIMPVSNTTAINDYSEVMVWNSTLGRFNSHLAIDFFATEGTDVMAVYDGTIKSVESSLLTGTTIIIDHGNGLFSKYNSLADGESVSVGQTVKQGDVIGQVSVTNRQEYKDGAHLHFEVIEDGAVIDPDKYLEINEK